MNRYEAKKYENLLGVEGIGEETLKNHFALYEGYVKNTDKLNEALGKIDPTTPEYAELKRRFGWEFNGIRLHEYYFENIKKEGSELDKNSDFAKKLSEEFGSLENWQKDFKSMGAMRGIGWIILYYDLETKRLFNCWINEHDAGHLTGAKPLLVMDVFEHAFMIDYGLKRADYVEAFFEKIDWEAVNQRFLR